MNKISAFFILILVSLHVTALDIITPPGDDRQLSFFELENNLKVLLISDPESEVSAASLDVNIGSGDDPLDRFGLAHFLEHMLFLGTKKYPVAGSFQDFINGHGGNHNAYTSLQHTNYFFDVDPNHFEPALDRFAQFFIAPLFNDKYVERERNAVESEFRSNYTSEYRRQEDVFRELVIPGHALSHFRTGNLQTLALDRPRNLREDLLAFYDDYYGADRMVLVVTSHHSIEQLSEWVTKKFAAIKPKASNAPPEFSTLFEQGFLPATVYMKPEKEIRAVSFIFPVPPSRDFQESKPTQYIGHLLGHEGKGSLLSALKTAGLATSLSAGGRREWRGGETFEVYIELTEAGINQIPEIRTLMFNYLDKIKRDGVNEWRFAELKNLGLMEFNFGEKIDPIREVTSLSNRLHRVEASKLFISPYAFEEFNKELIVRYLNQMQPNNLLTFVVSKSVNTTDVSEYYGSEYSVEKETADSFKADIDNLASLIEKVSLPNKNPFIPTNFTLVNSKKNDQVRPKLIHDKKQLKLWFAPDSTFDTPKVIVKSRLISDEVTKGSDGQAAAMMFSSIVKDMINETAYDANIGGLRLSLNANARGMTIEASGYSDTLDEYLKIQIKHIEKYIKNKKYRASVNAQWFSKNKLELVRKQRNKLLNKPIQRLYQQVPATLYSPYNSTESLLSALEGLEAPVFDQSLDKMFEQVKIETLIFGNVDVSKAKKYGKVLHRLQRSAPSKSLTQGRVVNVVGNNQYLSLVDVENNDAAIIVYYQGLNDTIEARAKALLLQQVVSTPFYSHLRTEKQLGYVVFATNYTIKQVPALAAVIQSPEVSADQLYIEIQTFFEEFASRIDENFERDKQGLLSQLTQPAKNPSELVDDYWGDLLLGQTTFDDRQKLIQAVRNTTIEQVKELYKNVILKDRGHVIFASNNRETHPDRFPGSPSVIEDIEAFKKPLPNYVYP